MIVVTVNRDGLERGTATNPIRVENPAIGSAAIAECSEVVLTGEVRVVYRPDYPRADGARVWIEADGCRIIA